MANRTVLISGLGIAGTTLAYWLLQRGFEPVIVERAPGLRAGGYILDFWGVGYDVAERMDLIPILRQLGYANDRIIFVGKTGRARSTFGGKALRRALGDRFLSIQRDDLARAIYATVRDKVETIFNDEISLIESTPDGVEVCFKGKRVRSFDLVVGADGLHSSVRASVSSMSGIAEHRLGYHAAIFVTGGYPKRDEHTYLSYAAPGRQISRFALRNDQTGFLLVLARKDNDPTLARDMAAQKRLLCEAFSINPWIEWPDIEKHLEACSELYFDAVSQIELPAWSSGRVALVGDAAYCPSLLAGEGAAFAMAGAYVLAGELERAGGNHTQAFAAYEQKFRPFIERKQKSARAFASSFAPKTSFGLLTRDVVLHLAAIPAVADRLMERFVADRYALPKY